MAPPKKDNQKEDDDEDLEDVIDEVGAPDSAKKKRLCRTPGCTRVIKSQGHCQRHGARAKRCKVDGCDKQAQGTHDGMCKRHWKALHFPSPAPAKSNQEQPPPPQGVSVYDTIIPSSISYRPIGSKKLAVSPVADAEGNDPQDPPADAAGSDPQDPPVADAAGNDPQDPPSAPKGVQVMPLIAFLEEGRSQEAGWHRDQERRARGMFPQTTLTSQLEPWERQLALVEILLLSGGTPYANFKDLAHGWGREIGFHNQLASSVCERRGEVERKKRSDSGRTMTEDEREAFRAKRKRAKAEEDAEAVAVLAATEELVSATEDPNIDIVDV